MSCWQPAFKGMHLGVALDEEGEQCEAIPSYRPLLTSPKPR